MFLSLVVFLACSSESEPPQKSEPLFGDSLSQGWNKIEVDEAICSRGDDYAFAVKKGSSPNILIDFIGGGACWDEFTCGFADATFTDNVDWIDDIEGLNSFGEGIYDSENPDNPFKDYHHVIIPYCTGDVHWGDSVQTYGTGSDEVTINHKGGVNAEHVLSWVFEHYEEPERIFMTGCSAGAYGSIMWSPEIAEQYPDADFAQFGDSGVGIVTQTWFQDSFPAWNAEYSFPAHIPTLDPSIINVLEKDTTYIYTSIAEYYPQARFSQFNAYADDTQVMYYQIMGGGDSDEWTSQMFESIDLIKSERNNFSHYTAGGSRHCIIVSNDMYTLQTNGVDFESWLRELVEGNVPEDVVCTDCQEE